MLLEHPAIKSALTDDTVTVSSAASPKRPHFKKLFLTRQPRQPHQVRSAAIAINAISQMIFCMLLLNELSAGRRVRRFGCRMAGAAANLKWTAAGWVRC